MSYSSNLITLRTLALQLRALADTLASNPGLTVSDYLSFHSILDQAAKLREVIDEKTLVLEVCEDEEGMYVGYELTLGRRTYGSSLNVHPEEAPLKLSSSELRAMGVEVDAMSLPRYTEQGAT